LKFGSIRHACFLVLHLAQGSGNDSRTLHRSFTCLHDVQDLALLLFTMKKILQA
jgi:hypothetical protein